MPLLSFVSRKRKVFTCRPPCLQFAKARLRNAAFAPHIGGRAGSIRGMEYQTTRESACREKPQAPHLPPCSHTPTTDATVCAGCGEAAAGWPGAQNTSWRHRDAKSRSCVHTKTARWHVVVMIMMTLLELNIKQNLKPNEASSWTVLWCSSPPAALSLQQLYLMSRMTMMAMMTRTIKATMRRICMSRVKEQPMRN